MNKIIRELKKIKVYVKKNFNIKNLTAFKIGGKVDLFIKVESINQLINVIKILNKNKKKWIVLGNMTNILINEKKLKKAIIILTGNFNEIFIKDKKIFYAGAGVKIADLMNFVIKNGIGNMEFMAGIPGTIGGAIFMNAGAFGKNIGKLIKNIYVITPKLEYKNISNNGKIFSYRKSVFQKNKYIILGADFSYKKRNTSFIKKEILKILKFRQKKHPYNYPSAGSFFKNLKKYSAGSLIEKAGLKGLKIGGAEVSEKHANFIINKGRAKFSDVIKLSGLIKKEVFKKFKIKLNEEVRIIK